MATCDALSVRLQLVMLLVSVTFDLVSRASNVRLSVTCCVIETHQIKPINNIHQIKPCRPTQRLLQRSAAAECHHYMPISCEFVRLPIHALSISTFQSVSGFERQVQQPSRVCVCVCVCMCVCVYVCVSVSVSVPVCQYIISVWF